jgi:hypothetical protein
MGLSVDDVAPSKVTPFALRHTVRHAVKMAIPEVMIFVAVWSNALANAEIEVGRV